MTVFGNEMHIVVFLIALFELIFFFYQLIHYLSRPSDKKRLYYLILLYLLIQYNVISGLFPDKNFPIDVRIQNIVAFSVSIFMGMYLPFYLYKAFDLARLKFYAYWGSLLFLFLPFIGLFVIPLWITGNLELSRKLLVILPFCYTISLLYSLIRAIKTKKKENGNKSIKEEIVGALTILFWLSLPIKAFFQIQLNQWLQPIMNFHNGSEVLVIISTNLGLLVLTLLFTRQGVIQTKDEYRRLQELTTSLSEKVAERTKEIELLNEQRTNNFINLTHETKTPLTLINNYLDEYIRKNGESEELQVIKSSTEKLTKDIVNFFDMERFNKGVDIFDHHQIADFSYVLTHSITLFRSYASTKNITIIPTIQDHIYVQADPSAIFRIVNNLIENAIKYSEKDSDIHIILQTHKEKVQFIVRDKGMGIPAELRGKVFEPYYQINREKRNYQGMGMGLAIVKQVVDSLGGEININENHQNNRGTELSISLSQHQLSAIERVSVLDSHVKSFYFVEEQLQLTENNYDEDKPTILVVEDHIPLLNYLIKKLNEHYNVYVAINGFDAIERLKTVKNLDLIVSDIMMDKMDGLELCKAIVANKKFSHIPFIFTTAKTTLSDKLAGLNLGAVDYIQKPFSIDLLISKINAILNNLENQRFALVNKAFKTLTIADNRGQENNHFQEGCTKFRLTSREVDIVKLVANGNTYKQIAQTLFISENTVSKHIQNIFEKVGVTNKVELLKKLEPDLSHF